MWAGVRFPRCRWALLTSGVMLLAWAVASGVPFFPDLVSLIGALTGAPLAFLAPPLFYLRALHCTGRAPRLAERAVCIALVLLPPRNPRHESPIEDGEKM